VTYRHLADPCRNFCIFNMLPFVDPRDGREKLCLSNFTAGGTGNLVFMDIATGDGEALSLPSDSGAWALLLWDERTLLVGTCPTSGYLLRLDLPSRRWAEPLRVESETYIWNLGRGSNGRAYGGTWPGCALLEYDPGAHTLRSLGRLSENPKDCYSRVVHGELPGYLFIDVGHSSDGVVRWNLAAGTGERFGPPGARIKEITADWISTVRGGAHFGGEEKLDYFDTRTFAPVDAAAVREPAGAAERAALRDFGEAARIVSPATVRRLRDGGGVAVRGQEVAFFTRGAARARLLPIPTPAPPTRILTIVSDPEGRIWGASGLGQTIFRYDPVDGGYWNSPAVCNGGGEVYGMRFAGGRLFLSAYAGGDHVVHDPAAPWDQISNANPRTLEPVGPELCRPEGRSVIGPDGAFWTGWMARYGVYGGGLSRVDTASGAVRSWRDPVPGQAVGWLEGDERHLYLTTCGAANGLPSQGGPFHFVVWDPAGRTLLDHVFAADETPGRIACAGGRVLVAVAEELRIFDPGRMAFTGSIPIRGRAESLVAMPGGRVAAFSAGRLLECDPVARTCRELCAVPEDVHTAAVTPAGTLYFAVNATLHVVEP
jgi:hypothetical protein